MAATSTRRPRCSSWASSITPSGVALTLPRRDRRRPQPSPLLEAASDLLTVARERFTARDYRGAALLLASAIESGQGYADTHHMLGMCYALSDARDEAL